MKTKTSNLKQWADNKKLFKLVCCYCNGNIGNGKLLIEGEVAHQKCHDEACK